MGSSSREMEGLPGESVHTVVRRRQKTNRKTQSSSSLVEDGGGRQVSQTDRQSICFSAGFLSFSPQKSVVTVHRCENNVSGGPIRSSQSSSTRWRHSYACDGDGVSRLLATSRTNRLDSIREEDNDPIAARSATRRASSLMSLTLSS